MHDHSAKLCCLLLCLHSIACRSLQGSTKELPGDASVQQTEYGSQPAPKTRVGVGFQAYPTGVISTAEVRLDLSLMEQVSLRAGINSADRQDFGEHDDEYGSGPGLGVGYRYFLDSEFRGTFFGARVDLWWLDINWEEDGDKGSTDILVLQPTAEVGYAWDLGGSWRLETSLGFGFEVNVDTDGEDVGEGPILLGGVGISYAF